MGWKETWRETVESFVRELRGPEAEPRAAGHGVEDGLARAIAGARAEAAAVELELQRTEDRLTDEEAAAAVCLRRREMAERIGDVDTAAIAARFRNRHEERAALLRRKRDVLRDERALTRIELAELLDLARADAPQDAAEPFSGEVDDAGFRDLEVRRRERDAQERLDELKRRGSGR